MNDFLGRVHFFGSLIFINGVFLPMFFQGMAGMHRRWYDGGKTYEGLSNSVVFGHTGLEWNTIISLQSISSNAGSMRSGRGLATNSRIDLTSIRN